jgi:hypothetical protein
MNLFDSLVEYLELGDVARNVRDSLAFRMVAPHVRMPEGAQQAFGHALSQLGNVREGFAVSLRTTDTTSPSELRELVSALLFNWEQASAVLGFGFAPDDKLELPHVQLLSFAHSYVTMGVIPSLPPDAVTFPQERRTYADIHAPGTPGELLQRIEELEEVVSEAETSPLEQIDFSRLRRTYGFFETSAWLVSYHAAKFKKKK